MAIENALKEVPGVIDQSINVVTAKAVVDYDPSVVTIDTLVKTIRNTGYEVAETPTIGVETTRLDREQASRKREIALYRNQFLFTIIFGIPLLLGMLAMYVSSIPMFFICLLYTSDAADDLTRVDLGGR